MNRFLILLMILSCGFCFGQTSKKCDVYQFAGSDSTKKTITLRQKFNSSGQITSETYHDFKENAVEGTVDGSYFYFYKDTLLIKRTFIDENKDSTKMLCYYNDKNQLITQEHFTYEKRIRKDVDKGLGRPGGCIVTEADYEKGRTWKQTSEINYSYNKNGNKVLYDATKLHYTSQDKYTWAYDSLGRVLKYSSFDGQKLIWTEEYSYFSGGYKFTRTWFDYNGNPKHLKTQSWEYTPQYTITYYLDGKGRKTKEVTTTEKDETVSTELTFYNSTGQIARTVYYDGCGKPELTHIYVYH